MKTLYGTLFLLLQGFAPLFGQSWFTGNPHWTNRYTAGMGAPGIEYVHISGDTVLGGKPVKIFSKHLVMDAGGQESYSKRFAYQSGDTIWTWASGDKFRVLYNFSLSPGDTLVMEERFGTPLVSVIDSVGLMEVSGTPLRFQKIRWLLPNSPFVCKSTIIERIGLVNGTCLYPPDQSTFPWLDHFFADESNLLANDFPRWNFCNYTDGDLTFEDQAGGCPPLSHPACDVLVEIIQGVECALPMVVSTGEILMPCTAPDSLFNLPVGSLVKIGYVPASCFSICQQGTYVDITCLDGVTNSVPSLENISLDVRLHPNPASRDVFVENFAPEEILIFDARGAVVKTIFSGAKAHFSVAGLPPGAYFVKMSDRKKVAVKKLRVD